MNPKSAMAYLYEYFDKLEKDACQLNNTVCSKGCSSCCSSDFEVSIVEYFAILRYSDTKNGQLLSQHMKDLFYASFNKTLDEFVYTLFIR